MSRDLKTSIHIDTVTRGLDKIAAARKELLGVGDAAKSSDPAARQLNETLSALANQQQLIQSFSRLKTATVEAKNELQKTQQVTAAAARAVKERTAELTAAAAAERVAAAATAQQRQNYEQLKAAVKESAAELENMRARAAASTTVNGQLAEEIKTTAGQLRQLRTETANARRSLTELTTAQTAAAKAVKAAEREHQAATAQMKAAVATARSATEAYEAKRQRLHDMRAELQKAGVASTDLAGAQRRLAGAVDEARNAYVQAQAAAAAAAAEQAEAAERSSRAQAEAAAAAARAQVEAADRAARANAEAAEEARRVAQELNRIPAAAAAMRRSFDSIGASIQRLQNLFFAWQGAMAAISQLSALGRVADEIKNVESRIQLLNSTTHGFNTNLGQTADLAKRTFTSLGTVSQLVGSLARAGQELGLTQGLVLRVTETINKANQLSGQSAQAADAAVVQLVQGLQSGVLRGEEFNSVMEQAPRLAQALAAGLNVPLGALRAMANEGRLTSQVVIEALRNQSAVIDREFEKLSLTIGRATSYFSTAWAEWIGDLDSTSGASARVSEAIIFVADNLGLLGDAVVFVGTLIVLHFATRAVSAMTAYMHTQVAVAGVTGTVTAAHVALGAAVRAAWAALAASPAFIILGLVELARVIDFLATNYDKLKEKVTGYIEQLRLQAEAERSIDENSGRLAERYAEISAATGVTVKSMAELDAAVAAGKIHFDQATGSWKAGAASLGDVLAASRENKLATSELSKAVTQAAEPFKALADAAREALQNVNQRLGETRAAVTDALGGVAEIYAAQNAELGAALAQQIEAIRERYRLERAELETSNTGQRDSIAANTQLLLDALASESAAQRAAAEERRRLIDEEAAARIFAAQVQGENERQRMQAIAAAEREATQLRKESLDAQLVAYQEHVSTLNSEIHRHLSEVRRIEAEKRGLAQTTEEAIREIRRAAMTDEAAHADKIKAMREAASAARRALEAGDFEEAKRLGQQSLQIARELAAEQARSAKAATEAEGEYSRAARESRTGVEAAIREVLKAEQLVNEALDAEGKAHQKAADAAEGARDGMQGQIADVRAELEKLTEQLSDEMKVKLSVDTEALQTAVTDAQALIAEQEFLAKVDADFQAAQKQLEDYAELLKAGKTLPVDANFDGAKAALEQFSDYAKDKGALALEVKTEQATAAIDGVTGRLTALNDVRTQSMHAIESNAGAVRAEIASLSGQNTSSTHTINVIRVEQHAAGGVVGASRAAASATPRPAPALPPQRFAAGGSVAKAMDLGGRGALLARAEQVGGLSLRKRAEAMLASARRGGQFMNGAQTLRSYGEALARITRLIDNVQLAKERAESRNDATRFAAGGSVAKAMDLGGRGALLARAEQVGGLSLRKRAEEILENARSRGQFMNGTQTLRSYGEALARITRLIDNVQLAKERAERRNDATRFAEGGSVAPTWMESGAVPGTGDTDSVSRTLPAGAFVLRKAAVRFYSRSGIESLIQRAAGAMPAVGAAVANVARTAGAGVNALLMPGEHVINPATVARLGVPFFEALNAMQYPPERFADGGLVGGAGAGAHALLAPQTKATAEHVTVTINMPQLNKSASVRVGSRADAATLESLLRDIGAAAGVAQL